MADEDSADVDLDLLRESARGFLAERGEKESVEDLAAMDWTGCSSMSGSVAPVGGRSRRVSLPRNSGGHRTGRRGSERHGRGGARVRAGRRTGALAARVARWHCHGRLRRRRRLRANRRVAMR